MTKTLTTLALTLCIFVSAMSQMTSHKPKDLVKAMDFNRLQSSEIFSSLENRSAELPTEVEHYTLLDLKKDALASMVENATKSNLLELAIPYQASELVIQLVKVDIHAGGQYVKTMPSGSLEKIQGGLHYRGIVKGNDNSLVAISIFENEVMGFISEGKKTNLTIGKLKNSPNHIIYEDADLRSELAFECATPDPMTEYTDTQLNHDTNNRALSDCVRLYLE